MWRSYRLSTSTSSLHLGLQFRDALLRLISSDWIHKLAHVSQGQHRSARGELLCEVQQFVNMAYSVTVT